MFRNSPSSLFRWMNPSGRLTKRKIKTKCRRTQQLWLEPLEDRCLLSVSIDPPQFNGVEWGEPGIWVSFTDNADHALPGHAPTAASFLVTVNPDASNPATQMPAVIQPGDYDPTTGKGR